MTSVQWLILVAAVLVLAPVALFLVRRWDYRRQLSGKRPMRRAGAGQPARREEGQAPSSLELEMQAQADLARLKARQNGFGAK